MTTEEWWERCNWTKQTLIIEERGPLLSWVKECGLSPEARKVEEIDLSYKVPERNVALLFHLHFISVGPVSDFYQTIR